MPSALELDRLAGSLVGLAAGDALAKIAPSAGADRAALESPAAPGEWSLLAASAIALAQFAGEEAGEPDRLVRRFYGSEHGQWLHAGSAGLPPTEGSEPPGPAAALVLSVPIAITYAGQNEAIAEATEVVAQVGGLNRPATEALLLCSVAVERAIRDGRLDGIHDGLALLPEDRRASWQGRLDAAVSNTNGERQAFRPEDPVVAALLGAYAATVRTPVPRRCPAQHLEQALVHAAASANDRHVVAAIAGGLLGARWGISAVPFRWTRRLGGSAGLRTRDLVRVALRAQAAGAWELPDGRWPDTPRMQMDEYEPFVVSLPGDEGVLLGGLSAIDEASARVDAVVSLCRVGYEQVPTNLEHHEVWLLDRSGRDDNPNLEFVLHDTVEAIATLRGEGKRVLLHCHAGQSRTPTVAALYLATREGITPTRALERVTAAIPRYVAHNSAFVDVLARDSPP